MWPQGASSVSISLLVSASLLHLAGAQDTVTIFDASALSEIRPCAATCLRSVAGAIDCASSPLVNSCFCRADLTEIATSTISFCVNLWCNGGIAQDAASLISIYQDYCSGVNGNAPAQNTAAPTTSGTQARDGTQTDQEIKTTIETVTTKLESTVTRFTGTITTNVPSSVTVVVIETFTTILDDKTLGQLAEEYRSSHGSGGLEKGYQVAIAVGVVAAVIIILLLFMNKIRRRIWGHKVPYGNIPHGAVTQPIGGIMGSGHNNAQMPSYYR